MKFLLLLLSLISIQVVAQQSTVNTQKIMIQDNYGYFCKSKKDGTTVLKKINMISNQQDSMQMFCKPKGMFNTHPVVWDLNDSLIFYIRLSNDSGGMTYPELHAFQSKKIARYSNAQSSDSYIFSNETLKDNNISPLYYYIGRIHYKEDSLTGPLFFDISVRKDTLRLYIYIHDRKEIEVWTFNHFPLIVNNVSDHEANQIIKKKAWALYKKIPVEIQGPFQLGDINGKLYAFDHLGDIWDLSGTTAKKKRSFPSENTRGALIVDKDKKTVKYFKKKEMYNTLDNFKNIIKRSSVDIKIK